MEHLLQDLCMFARHQCHVNDKLQILTMQITSSTISRI